MSAPPFDPATFVAARWKQRASLVIENGARYCEVLNELPPDEWTDEGRSEVAAAWANFRAFGDRSELNAYLASIDAVDVVDPRDNVLPFTREVPARD